MPFLIPFSQQSRRYAIDVLKKNIPQLSFNGSMNFSSSAVNMVRISIDKKNNLQIIIHYLNSIYET